MSENTIQYTRNTRNELKFATETTDIYVMAENTLNEEYIYAKVLNVPSQVINILTNACHKGLGDFFEYVRKYNLDSTLDYTELDTKEIINISMSINQYAWVMDNFKRELPDEIKDITQELQRNIDDYTLHSVKVELELNTLDNGYILQTDYNVNTYYADLFTECMIDSNYQYMRDNFECNTDSHNNVFFLIELDDINTMNEKLSDILDMLKELDDYPLLDEDLHTQLEYEKIEEYCEDNYKYDFREMIEYFGDSEALKNEYHKIIHDSYSYHGELWYPFDSQDNMDLIDLLKKALPFNLDNVTVEITAYNDMMFTMTATDGYHIYSENYHAVDFIESKRILAEKTEYLTECLKTKSEKMKKEYIDYQSIM